MTTCVHCDKPEAEHGSWIDTHRFTPDTDAIGWHVVSVTNKRIDCCDGCDSTDPHIHEYRASDENPNRPAPPPTGEQT